MKKILLKKNLLNKICFYLILGWIAMGQSSCTIYVYTPNSSISFSGTTTYCRGDVATPNTYTYGQCDDGGTTSFGGSSSGTSCTVQWYYNTTGTISIAGSTALGGPVAFTSAAASTGTLNYTPLTSTAGVFYYFAYITWGSSSCNASPMYSNAQIVTISTPPGPISGTLANCVGGTATLTDAPGGGTWTSGTTSVATIGLSSGLVTGIGAGTSNITYTNGVCRVTAVVTINPIAAISGTRTVCVGTTTTLSDAAGAGTWTSTATGVATVGTSTGVVTGVSPGTTTISYTSSLGCPAAAVVTVSAVPSAITGTLSVCRGLTTALTDATAGGGTWSSGTTSVATVVSSTGVVTGVAAGTSNITFTTTTTGCSIFVPVTVNPTPVAITGTANVCQGSTTALTDATGGGVWSSTATGVATVGTDGIVTGVSIGTSTISYILGTCSVTQVVTVNLQPVAITGNAPICQTFTESLSDATTGGVWSSVTTGVATITGGGVVTGVGVGTSTISYTIGSCAATVVATVNTQPVAITGTLTLCNSFTTALTDATGGGVWSSAPLGIATVSGAGVVTGAGVGTATISYTIGSCAVSAIVTVNTQPAAITGNAPICQTFTESLSDATSGGVWSSVTTGVATITGSGVVTGVAVGTSIISYTIGSCAATVVATVNTQPAAITGTFTVCRSFTTALTDATSGGVWSSTPLTVASVSGTGVVTGVSVGTATISYTIGSCAVSADVTVNTQPVAITGNAPICETFSITLSDATSGGAWTSVTTGVATITSGGVLTGVSAGTSVISYTIGSCVATTIATVNTQPAAITGTFAVCQGLTTTLSDATGGGVWSSAPSATASITGGGVVTGNAAGTATVSYTLGSCAASVIVTVEPLPGAINGTKTVCSGFTTSLSDGIGGGTWSSSNSAVASIGLSTGLVTGGAVVVSTTVTITYTLGTGCITTTTVTVNPIPTTILGSNAVCFGSTTTLSDAGGGTWGSNNSGIASVSAGGVVTGNAVGVTTITYTLATGCYITTPMTVNPLPGAISGPTTVCPFSSITLSDGTFGGTWASNNSGIATVVSGTGVVTGVAAGSTTITYTLGTGCYVTYNITVNAAPSPVITPLGDTTFCPGGFVALTANTGAGITYQWYVGSGAIPGALSSSYIANTAGSYQVLETNSLGCSTLSNAILVTIDVPLATITTAGATTICAGTSITLDANTGTGLSYQWLLSGGAIPGAVGSSYTTSTPGDYSVIVTNVTGCSATSGVMTVSTNPSPTANIVLSGPLTFCQNSMVIMTADFATDYVYQWSDGTGPIAGATNVAYTASVAGTYSVLVTNSVGCTATSVVMTVVVNPLPNVAITAAGPTIFCTGGSVILNATAVAGYTYQWFNGTTPIAGETNSSYTATTGGGYRVLVTDPTTGCSDKTHADTVVTLVTTPIVVPITTASFCWGGSSVLSTSVSGAAGTVLYQWYFNGVIIAGATGPVYNAAIPGFYSCQITIPSSCTSMTAAVAVSEFPLPNPTVTFDGTFFHTGSYFTTYQWYRDLVAIAGANSDHTPSLGSGNYKVAVTDTNGCQSYSNIYVYSGGATTTVGSTQAGGVIRIYPNPAQTMVHIESANEVRAVLSGVDGKIIFSVESAKDIDISSLSDGIYMIMLYDDNGAMVKAEKLVKTVN